MALAEKKVAPVDVATVALWRVAENGDVEELTELLPRVRDIDARNEHGVTALMRAAQNGRVKMVRALLEHGADANIKRNDKFTALALAAFFGHTEVVRTLMEHGADLQASTRGGTSPQMWATARTFNEVVDQLEKNVPAPLVEPVNKEASAAAVRVPRRKPAVVREAPLVVRTLKDPPEIWDLVHEAPRRFDPRTAFLTRVKSQQAGFAFRLATVVVLIAMCVVGVVVLRRVQARGERASAPQPVTSQTGHAEQVAPRVAATEAVARPTDNNKPAVVTPTVVVPAFVTPGFATRRGAVGFRGVRSAHRVEVDVPVVAATETAQPVAAPVEKAAPPVRVEASAKPKANVPLSPQLITPGKNSSGKTKVIQWP